MGVRDVDDNAPQQSLGGVTGAGFMPGQSGNPGGQPKWVKHARDAMRGELFGLAQRHLRWVLSGVEPTDANEAERGMYKGVTVEDRTTAAKLVCEYSLPRPKQAVGLKHSVDEGQALSFIVDLKAGA